MTAFTFLALAVACLVQAYRLGGFGWLLVWPAISFGLIAFAYLRGGVGVYGKRPGGTMNPAAAMHIFPANLLMKVAWWISNRLSRSRPLDEIVPGVFIGRRPTAVPEGVVNVIDLAGEFAAHSTVRSLPGYRSRPVLDRSIASDAEFVETVKLLIESRLPTLVHCAQGHGRSAQVVAGVLIARGVATSAEEAVAMIREKRPRVRLSPIQQRQLERCVPTFVGFASYLTSRAQSHTKSRL